ncbi:hypothetical protein [Deinococcus aquatilis]|uniref:hypothetical protein n=1 Tax=Deinococcus aquatilis TaxID=519440 RepID=UPI000379FFE3|nr:hypothetical protein [Deinococcus aquatilis]
MTGWQEEKRQEELRKRRLQGEGTPGNASDLNSRPSGTGLPQWEEPAPDGLTGTADSAAPLRTGTATTFLKNGPEVPPLPGLPSFGNMGETPSLPAGVGTVPTSGPLAALVGRLAGQLQGQRQARAASGALDQGAELGTMKQLALQLAQQYRKLGTQATPTDLAAALNALPDASDRQLLGRAVVGLISAMRPGERAALERAVNDPAALLAEHANPQPTPPVQVSAKAAPSGVLRPAGGSETGGVAAPAASGSPVVTAVSTTRSGTPPTKRPSTTPQGRPTPAKTTPAPTRKPVTAAPRAKTPQSKQAAAPAKAPANKAAPKDLKLVRLDALSASGLNVRPTATLGKAAVFEPREWGKLKQARQQQKRQPEQAATQSEKQPSRASGKKRGASPVPSVTVKAAALKKEADKDRKANQKALTAALDAAGKQTAQIDAARSSGAAKVQGAARAAEARIAAALKTAESQIAAAASAATARVQAAATRSTAQVNAAHRSTVQGIRQEGARQKQAAQQALTALKTQLTSAKTALDTRTNAEFSAAVSGMKAAGSTVAGQATALGNSRASQYAAEALPKQSGWEDFKNGEDYPKNKRQAKVDAAREVGKSFAESFREAANEQAAKLPESKGAVLQGNGQLLAQYLASLAQSQAALFAQMNAAQQAAIRQADALKAAQLAAIAAQKQAAVAGIAQTRSSLQTGARQTARQQQGAVKQQASRSVSALSTQAAQAKAGLTRQIGAARTTSARHLDQDSATFAKGMAGFLAHMRQAAQGASRGMTTSAAGSAGSLTRTGTQAASGLTALGTQARTACTAAATSASTGLTQLAAQARTAFGTQGKAYKQQSTAMLTGIRASFKTTGERFKTDTKKVGDSLKGKLGQAIKDFQTALVAAKDQGSGGNKAEDPTITEKAEAAADAVKPRWKAAVGILIDVVVAVVVTAAMVALAATGIGVVALIGLGILIGAASAVASQGLKDLVDGKFSGWKAYGAAALGGAIGGAFGGVGGAAATALTKGVTTALVARGMGKLAQTGITLGLEGTINTGVGLAGEVASGYANQGVFGIKYDLGATFSAGNIAKNLAMNVGGSGLARLGQSPRIQTFLNDKVGGLTTRFQTEFPNTGRTLSRFNARLDDVVLNNRAVVAAGETLTNFGTKLGSIGGKGMPAPHVPAPPAGSAGHQNTPTTPGETPPHLLGDQTAGTPRNAATTEPLPVRETGTTTATEQNARANNGGESTPTNTPPTADAPQQTGRGGTQPETVPAEANAPAGPDRSTTREQWKAQQHQQRIQARQQKALQEFDQKLQTRISEIPDSPAKQKMLEYLRQVDDLDFSTRGDQSSFYSGPGNRDMALDHLQRGGDAIDGTPGGKALEALALYKEFETDVRLADLVWMKASMKYATGASGNIHLFVDGALPTRVFATIERPLLESNPQIDRWNHYQNPNRRSATTQNAGGPDVTPVAPTTDPAALGSTATPPSTATPTNTTDPAALPPSSVPDSPVPHDPDADALVQNTPFETQSGGSLTDHLSRAENLLLKTGKLNLSGGVSGAHNMEAFYAAIEQGDGQVLTKTPIVDINGDVVPGLFEIEYQVPKIQGSGKDADQPVRVGGQIQYKTKTLIKTVYDPAVYTDAQMTILAERAAAGAYPAAENDFMNNFVTNPNYTAGRSQGYSTAYAGINFQFYLRDIQGTATVTNSHPTR